MSHKCSVYRNSCIRPPVNPASRRPTPHYERSSSAETATEVHKIEECNGAGRSEKISLCEEIIKENSAFQSLMDFYTNIPDYRDINHLSEAEFYRQLEGLKIRQDELKKSCGVEVRNSTREPAQGICLPHKSPKTNDPPEGTYEHHPRDCDSDSLYSSTQRPCSRNPSKKSGKSVRINSGLSTLRSDTTHGNISEDEKSGRRSKMRSKSASPFRSQVTVPRPFKMTQREEEERMLEDLMMSTKSFTPREEQKTDSGAFKANPVPLTSRIPLYNSIRADQEHKSQLAKLNSSIELQSQMKPFHFTDKDDRPRSRCLSRSVSSTNLTTPDTAKSAKNFRAKPCPKNLFSNYFYNKMWEDEYFRNLNKKIRAEELLKMASLPPSMARRESKPRGDGQRNGHTRRSRRRTKKRGANREKSQSICDDRKEPKGNPGKCIVSHSGNSSNSSSSFSSPMPIYPINRPNLAATLRFQHSRKKLRELSKPSSPPEHLTRERHVDWGIRKNPAFKAIYYDGTNLEDIAVRVATRRAEQKLLVEDHKINMELMKQRVRAAPLLLEGATYWGPKVGQLTHTCAIKDPETRRSRRSNSTGPQSRNTSKMSYYSDTRKPSRKCPHEHLL